MSSAFFTPGSHAQEGQLASLHLRRDLSLPVILSTSVVSAEEEGYAEGVVTNTRFGSFPHSTIIGVPWGSQVRASKVDTGSRGRNGLLQQHQQRGKKRKADVIATDDLKIDDEDGVNTPRSGEQAGGETPTFREAVAAASGFLHVLPPTPENWTTSLPHRTQVVYTPDYSYILHRIRARPGTVLIEAGSGSGSFTHAAARAVFNGFPEMDVAGENGEMGTRQEQNHGRVFTYEFHAERYQKVKHEMKEHGLEGIVHATHRDVYKDGFLHQNDESEITTSPQANAVFLDLPAPWEALPHLTRDSQDGQLSALASSQTVHICTFSPCIEQAQKTISYLRRYGWLEIQMVEIQHKRIDVRREYTGLEYDGMRGVNPIAIDVEEAVQKLREVEKRAQDFHAGNRDKSGTVKAVRAQNKQQEAKLLYKEGKLVHRSEPELKTHTSYLVFAVLPRTWSEDDEVRAREKWSKVLKVDSSAPKSQRQLKREAKKVKSHKETRNGVDGNIAMSNIPEAIEQKKEVVAEDVEIEDMN